jgi:DNA-directed RNA polymerase I subunit RPA12
MATHGEESCAKFLLELSPYMFCTCGTLIHIRSNSTSIVCRRCKRINGLDSLKPLVAEKLMDRRIELSIQEVRGARIKHQCPECGAEEMMYNSAQLRSADEGQTVFLLCDCGYKLTMHS